MSKLDHPISCMVCSTARRERRSVFMISQSGTRLKGSFYESYHNIFSVAIRMVSHVQKREGVPCPTANLVQKLIGKSTLLKQSFWQTFRASTLENEIC